MPEPTQDAPPTPRQIFRGDNTVHEIDWFPAPPRWRQYSKEARDEQGPRFLILRDKTSKTVDPLDMVNAALLLRRPLLVTGKPGTGKSTLAEAVAHELKLGEVLVWPITTKTTLQSGLYQYDAIGRLNDAAIRRERLEIRRLHGHIPARPAGGKGKAKSAGAVQWGSGSSCGSGRSAPPCFPPTVQLPPSQRQKPGPGEQPKPRLPRVLLIDEVDKGDIDLPNDLLHVFEQRPVRNPRAVAAPGRPGVLPAGFGSGPTTRRMLVWIEARTGPSATSSRW